VKAILKICLGISAFVVICTGHPLGNFCVNQYSRLEVEMKRIKIRYVLDLAEIPTFQEQMIIDRNKDSMMTEDELETYVNALTPKISSNLILLLNDERLQIKASKSTAKIEIGVGNLPMLKIFWDFVAEFPSDLQEINKVVFENKNFSERIGWNEIVVNRENRVQVFNSTACSSGITQPNPVIPITLWSIKSKFYFIKIKVTISSTINFNFYCFPFLPIYLCFHPVATQPKDPSSLFFIALYDDFFIRCIKTESTTIRYKNKLP